ncbi:hypothetical protein MF271_05820 [Deinococcus sp. KNUC1210]|uniref:hypothetical protein n=1 Tax=Deinococcus sp. KNUC1210 TaxID=2917691 RepID=UPI001EEFE8B8|nr:hypothetical protein [Deinococcus sp. KNUC1210]ULH16137.1 hypothetical protein MF271_05820 [Deinococcus sp. KNUC1210]
MAKRFAYLDGQKVPRKKAEKVQDAGGEPLEIVYVRKETLRAVWQKLGKGKDGNLNELTEDLLHRWLYEQEQHAQETRVQEQKQEQRDDARKAQERATRKKNRAFDER